MIRFHRGGRAVVSVRRNLLAFFVAALSIALLAGGGLFIFPTAHADNVAQTLPLTQDWTNTGLITVDDNWSSVPGITGYRGDDITTAIGVNPQSLLADGTSTPVDVNANHNDPNTFISGGVTEFDGIANPVVAMQGSGTADAPFLLITLNTTGKKNIKVFYNLRDVDGSADNAVQQFALHYRVGTSGSFTNIPAGYVPDASSGPNLATLVTPVNVVLPSAADNQATVQLRIMTTNAVGNDEWVGVDDINITGTDTGVVIQKNKTADFDGDGKADVSVWRGSEANWYIRQSMSGALRTQFDWGRESLGDVLVPRDYDGDGKTDLAVFRPSEGNWYIIDSSTATPRVVHWGGGADVAVPADYDGDGKADVAIFRPSDGNWYIIQSSVNTVTSQVFGTCGDAPVPADYDGDGRADFAVYRPTEGNWYIRRSSNLTNTVQNWGTTGDQLVPADYDGDGKTDLAVFRPSEGNWYILKSTGGATVQGWGNSSDVPVPADYDGDNKADIAVFRAFEGNWYILNSQSNTVTLANLGQTDDIAIPASYITFTTTSCGAPPPPPPPGDPAEHLTMGNPSNATADVNNPTNYLLPKEQYVVSYHRDRGIPNWVSWHLDSTWIGSAPRQNDFRADPSLPAAWYHVTETDYQGSGFDRGHHTPSADRTRTIPDNSATFFMTNMMPQAPDNNQGPWEALESYARTLISQGNEVYIIAGGVGTGGTGSNGGTTTTLANGHVTVPAQTWKVMIVLPAASGDDVARVNNSTRTIAVIMPNTQGIRTVDWRTYRVSVDQVESLTGYDFFSNVSPSIQAVIEATVDNQ